MGHREQQTCRANAIDAMANRLGSPKISQEGSYRVKVTHQSASAAP